LRCIQGTIRERNRISRGTASRIYINQKTIKKKERKIGFADLLKRKEKSKKQAEEYNIRGKVGFHSLGVNLYSSV